MKLIVGLGNPGDKFIGVRHNLGFEVVEELVKKMDDGKWKIEEKFKSEIIKTPHLIFAKPQTYMNNSGLAVRQLVDYYKIPTTEVIVIHDDLDLPLGKIKVRLGGAAAGHHGVESIIKELGTDQFIRVRLGIGDSKTNSAEHYVLAPFPPNEKSKVKHLLKQAIQAIDILLKDGLAQAQNQFN